MLLKEPASMEECIYFTNRIIGNGKIKAWVFKERCPKCGKGLMGKPKDEKTGKAKIRAEEYTCPDCRHTVNKLEYEDTLTANIKYTCQHCSHQGEAQQSFKRKKIQRINEETGKKQSIDAIRFQCEKCKNNIDITKKMK
jgi:ssDNA-binding Zn-finger/Zn-ribbon topoisomerase 1